MAERFEPTVVRAARRIFGASYNYTREWREYREFRKTGMRRLF